MCSTVVSRSVELKLDSSTLPNKHFFFFLEFVKRGKQTVIRIIIFWLDRLINQSIILLITYSGDKQLVLQKNWKKIL